MPFNSSDISLVVIFQLAVYTGIPLTFMINGFLLQQDKNCLALFIRNAAEWNVCLP